MILFVQLIMNSNFSKILSLFCCCFCVCRCETLKQRWSCWTDQDSDMYWSKTWWLGLEKIFEKVGGGEFSKKNQTFSIDLKLPCLSCFFSCTCQLTQKEQNYIEQIPDRCIRLVMCHSQDRGTFSKSQICHNWYDSNYIKKKEEEEKREFYIPIVFAGSTIHSKKRHVFYLGFHHLSLSLSLSSWDQFSSFCILSLFLM